MLEFIKEDAKGFFMTYFLWAFMIFILAFAVWYNVFKATWRVTIVMSLWIALIGGLLATYLYKKKLVQGGYIH